MLRLIPISLIFFLLVAAPVLGFEPPNSDVNSGWGTDTQQLDEIIDELEESIHRAINLNAAHPGFIEALQDSLQKLKLYRDTLGDSGSSNYSWSTPFDLRLQLNSRFFNRSLGGFADRSGENVLIFDQPVELGSRNGIEALVFPASSHQGARLEADLTKFDAITMEMWIYLEDWGPDPQLGYSRLFADTGEDTFFMMVAKESPHYNHNSLVVGIGDYRVFTEPQSISLRRWHHVAVIHDGRKPIILIDGIPQRLGVFSGQDSSFVPPQSDWLIIGNNSRMDRRFHGAIEQLRIVDWARPVTEIQAEIGPLLINRSSTRLQNETIAGRRVNYGDHHAVIYNWRYNGVNKDALTTHKLGTGSMVVCLTVFGQVEEVSVYRAKTPISTSQLYAQSRARTTNAMYEISSDIDSDYRFLFVEAVVRKENGELETLTFSTLADDIGALDEARPMFVD